MVEPFRFIAYPSRISFGPGEVARVSDAVEALSCARALVLSTPGQAARADALSERLGTLSAGVFAGATMHTPVDVTEKALAVVRERQADCTVAIGGGSTTGLGKAIAYRTDLPQIVIPTTYAGSEVTPILGQTEDGVKTTLRDQKVLPEVVIYDPELTLGLPPGISATSALNAVAHAAEGLYAEDRNPVSSLMAAEGLRALIQALPVIQVDPDDLTARSDALYGAWLCGAVLASVGMALHHKLCHTLGGTFDLPHAETHAVILPHAVAFNAAAVPDLLTPIAKALNVEQPGLGLFEYAKNLGVPTSLKELGMPQDGITKAVDLAVANPYWNPRPIERPLMLQLLERAYHGDPPVS